MGKKQSHKAPPCTELPVVTLLLSCTCTSMEKHHQQQDLQDKQLCSTNDASLNDEQETSGTQLIFYSNSLSGKFSRARRLNDFCFNSLTFNNAKKFFPPQVKNLTLWKSQSTTTRNDFRMKLRNTGKLNWKMLTLTEYRPFSVPSLHRHRGNKTQNQDAGSILLGWGGNFTT